MSRDSRRAWFLGAAIACLIVVGCGGDGPKPEPRPVLAIAHVEILTGEPQAGHPVEVRTTVTADEETEDVGITYYLARILPDGSEDDEMIMLDSLIEPVVPASVESVLEPGKIVGHEIVRTVYVPVETPASEYYVKASIELMPLNPADPELVDYDGKNPPDPNDPPCTTTVGTDLRDTPDLVISDPIAETGVIVLGEEPDATTEGDNDPPATHWTGTVLVTSFGGAQTEGATVSALLEIPGKPLQPLKIWNSHEYVQIWRNDGIAGFKDTLQRLRSSVSNDVELVDVDGDDDLDIISAHGNSVVGDNVEDETDPRPNRVWLNDGTGSYQDSGQNLGNAYTHGLAVGDLDGDGDPDFVAGNAGAQPDAVWINEGGRGFFASSQEFNSTTTYAVALGDFDGDGDLDLVTAGDGTRIWTNDGDGNFGGSVLLDGGAVRDVVVADFDGDERPDIATAGEAGAIWHNVGGAFSKAFDLVDSLSVAAGDLDLDVDIDLLVGLEAGGIVPYRSAAGALQAATEVLGAGSHAYDIAIGDLNGDGLPDFAAGNDGGPGIPEPDQTWLNDGVRDNQFRFLPGQMLGGSDTRAVSIGNIDADSDQDLVSGNIGLPDRIEGNYVDDLEIAALKPNTPTRIQLDLHIPETIGDFQLHDELRAFAESPDGSLFYKVYFCIDLHDDIPEHESSAFDPAHPNDNCIEHELIILPPPDPNQPYNELHFDQDASANWGGKFIGIGVAGHWSGNFKTTGVRQRVEQKVPFTIFGWTLNIMRLTSDCYKAVDPVAIAPAPKKSRHELDLEFAGITVYSSSGEGSEDPLQDETENSKISLTFSVCLPPPIFDLAFISEEYQFGVHAEPKPKEDPAGSGTDEDEANKEPDDSTASKDPKGDGAKPDDKVGKKKRSQVKEGISGDIECGWVKVVPVGPIPLTIRIGGTGRIGFTSTLNASAYKTTDAPYYPQAADPDNDPIARIHYQFTPLASADGFVFLGLEISLGILKAKAGVEAKLLIIEYGYEIVGEVYMFPGPTEETKGIFVTDGEFTVTEVIRSLKGQVFLVIEIGIEADIGIATIKVTWKFKKSLFKYKGIEQKDVLLRLPARGADGKPPDLASVPLEERVFRRTQVSTLR